MLGLEFFLTISCIQEFVFLYIPNLVYYDWRRISWSWVFGKCPLIKKEKKRQPETTWLIFNNGLGKLGFAFLFQHGQPSLDSCFRFSALECVKTVLLILVKAQVCFRKDSNVCVSVGSPVLLSNRHQRPWDENVLWGRQAEGVFCLCLVGLGLPGIEINKVPAALSVVLSRTSDSWLPSPFSPSLPRIRSFPDVLKQGLKQPRLLFSFL